MSVYGYNANRVIGFCVQNNATHERKKTKRAHGIHREVV